MTEHNSELALVVCTYIMSFIMAFAMGAGDACNSLASSYGAGAAPVYFILAGGALFEFIGAMWGSGQIASKIASKIIPTIMTAQPFPYMQLDIMFAEVTASFVFKFTAARLGYPVSATHDFIGSLLGAGMAGLGPKAINARMMLTKVIPAWFISPALAAAICFVLINIVCLTTLNGAKASLRWRLFNMQCIMGGVFSLITYMLILIINKNAVKPGHHVWEHWMWAVIVGVFVFGFTVCRSWMAHVTMKEKPWLHRLGFVAKIGAFDEVVEFIKAEGYKNRIDFLGDSVPENVQTHDRPVSTIEGIFVLHQMYRFLMVMSSFTMSFAHGANDVANAITSMTLAQQVWYQENHGVQMPYKSKFPFLIGGAGLALGLIIMGRPVLETVGKKLVKLSFMVGFCS
jgi:inorganic phosphate transporter, PiT family